MRFAEALSEAVGNLAPLIVRNLWSVLDEEHGCDRRPLPHEVYATALN
jgi:hypothetical protein